MFFIYGVLNLFGYFKIYLLFLDLCDIKLVELIIVVDIILSILEEVF